MHLGCGPGREREKEEEKKLSYCILKALADAPHGVADKFTLLGPPQCPLKMSVFFGKNENDPMGNTKNGRTRKLTAARRWRHLLSYY